MPFRQEFSPLGKSSRRHRKMATRPAPQAGRPSRDLLKHILQLPGGIPCPCSSNTRPSWRQTNQPSNWRSPHRNHMAQTLRRIRRLELGSPCHEPDSTTPSWELTTPPANLQTHLHNCRDQLELVVASVGRKYDGNCSTTAAWLRPKRSTVRRHSCRDRLALQGLAERWGAAAAGASAAAASASVEVPSVAVWEEVLVVAWGMVWVELSASFQAKLSSRNPGQQSYSNNPFAPETTSKTRLLRCLPQYLPYLPCSSQLHNRMAAKWTNQRKASRVEGSATREAGHR